MALNAFFLGQMLPKMMQNMGVNKALQDADDVDYPDAPSGLPSKAVAPWYGLGAVIAQALAGPHSDVGSQVLQGLLKGTQAKQQADYQSDLADANRQRQDALMRAHLMAIGAPGFEWWHLLNGAGSQPNSLDGGVGNGGESGDYSGMSAGDDTDVYAQRGIPGPAPPDDDSGDNDSEGSSDFCGTPELYDRLNRRNAPSLREAIDHAMRNRQSKLRKGAPKKGQTAGIGYGDMPAPEPIPAAQVPPPDEIPLPSFNPNKGSRIRRLGIRRKAAKKRLRK